MFKDFTAGGQKAAHGARMFKQVIKNSVIIGLISTVGIFTYFIWTYPPHQYIAILKFLKSMFLWEEHWIGYYEKIVIKIMRDAFAQLKKAIIYGGYTSFVSIILFSISGKYGSRRKKVRTKASFPKTRIKNPFHRGFFLGKASLSVGSETKHILVSGGTGSGKTNAFNHIIPQIRSKKQKAVIIDTNGTFVNKYYDPSKDFILNPFDERGEAWHPWVECIADFDYEALAKSFIPFSSSRVNLKNVKSYSYNIILASLRSHRMSKQLKMNGLRRGNATSEGNNCLLHSIFQQLPIDARGAFSTFAISIRTRIEKTNSEELSINDELEGTQILTAVQNYLRENAKVNYHFNLTVLFADNEGNIASVDVNGIEQALDCLGDSLALRIIVVNYNHYEPLFEVDQVDHLTLEVEELGLEEKTSDNSSSLVLPSYVVNMPIKVDSDEETEDSSDEEIDQSFPQTAFQRPFDYYRLLPATEEIRNKKKKNTKRGKIVLLPPQQSANIQPKGEGKLSSLFTMFEEEEARMYSPSSQSRLGIAIGLNKMRSLSSTRNRSLIRTLNEHVVTQIPVEKIGFFWDGIWQKYNGWSWIPTTYEEVRRFYKQLKRWNPILAKTFRSITESHRSHMIPYREVRDTLKNSLATKNLVQQFRREPGDVYIVFLDGDIRSFRYQRQDPGMFSVLDENYLTSQFEIGSTGYTIREPNNPFLELSVLADLTVRGSTAKFIKKGVYYPEPCTAVKVPIGYDSIPERFSNPGSSDYESPKEMPRLIDEVLGNRKLDPQKAMVFDRRGSIVTALPKRMKRTFFSHKTRKNGFILWGLSDFQTMRGINQSHYNARDWALNLLPALNIRLQVRIGDYDLGDKKVIQDVLTSLLSRLFNAFDPIELAHNRAITNRLPFQLCLIDVLNDYKGFLTEVIPQTTERRNQRAPRRNARDLEAAQRKSQAVNDFWLYADSLSTVTSLLDLVKILLNIDFSQNLRAAAAESGLNLVEIFKSRLCLNYEELVINALEELIDKSIDKRDVPEIYIDIIRGVPITQSGSIRSTRRRLSELDLGSFYGISPLHMAALSGNLIVINWLKENFHSLYPSDGTDNYAELYPFEYALTHCRHNGVNLDLLVSVCCEEILDEVQEMVDNRIESIPDKALALNRLIEVFGTGVIQEYDGSIFIQAIKKGYKTLSKELSGLGDYDDDICEAILDLAPDIDENLINFAEEEQIERVLEELEQDYGDESLCYNLFRNNLRLCGYFNSPQSSDQESDYGDYDDWF